MVATITKEDSVASFEEWLALRDKAADLDKPGSKFDIQVDSKGHCLTSGNQDDELQRFDELARWVAIYLGHAKLKGEAARNFLAVLLRDYFMKLTDLRREVGLVGHDKEAIIEFPFKAAKIYFGELANQATTQRRNDESPTGESKEQEEEKAVIVDGKKVKVPIHWKKRDRVTYAQAAVILEYKQTRSIRQLVTDRKLRPAGTGYISVPSLLEFLDQKRPSPQN